MQFFGRKKWGEPRKPFTIIGLPDTQYYTENEHGVEMKHFHRQTEWLQEVRDSLNVVFVAHMGDCVENGDSVEDEWRRADTAMLRIEPGQIPTPDGIPYGISVGNHDQAVIHVPGNAQMFNKYFGEERFRGRGYYGGHFGEDNNNHFELFSASGIDFIAISFEYDFRPSEKVLAWADSLLGRYPRRKALIYSHYLVEARGDLSGQGRATYNRLRKHPNLFLMLAGHVPVPEGRRIDHYRGLTAHTLLSDFQDLPEGGSGFLRIMTFYPDAGTIEVRSYSPSLDSFLVGPESQFTLPFEADWEFLGERTVRTEEEAVLDWKLLEPGTTYEWYAVVSDEQQTVRTAHRQFTMPPIAEVTTSTFVPECEEKLVQVSGAHAYQDLLINDAEDILLRGKGVHSYFETDSTGCLINKNLLVLEEDCGPRPFRLFPTPANEHCKVEWPMPDENGGGALNVLDLQGRIVQRKAVSAREPYATIDVSGLPAGIYVVELHLPDHTYHRNLIVE